MKQLTCALCGVEFSSRWRVVYCSPACHEAGRAARAAKDTTPPVRRFMRRLQVTDSCWLWTGPINRRTGYGSFGISNGLTVSAHRFSYENFVGQVPTGLQLDHLCRVRTCVRPDHLEPVTARENQRRSLSFAGLNARKTTCPRGHAYDVIHSNGDRGCRRCLNENARRRRALKKETAA